MSIIYEPPSFALLKTEWFKSQLHFPRTFKQHKIYLFYFILLAACILKNFSSAVWGRHDGAEREVKRKIREAEAVKNVLYCTSRKKGEKVKKKVGGQIHPLYKVNTCFLDHWDWWWYWKLPQHHRHV